MAHGEPPGARPGPASAQPDLPRPRLGARRRAGGPGQRRVQAEGQARGGCRVQGRPREQVVSVALKPNCYCERCAKPVAGQKRTHRFRNTGAALTLLGTFGASALFMRKGVWHCPTCGSSDLRDLEAQAAPAWNADFAAKYPWFKWAAFAATAVLVVLVS